MSFTKNGLYAFYWWFVLSSWMKIRRICWKLVIATLAQSEPSRHIFWTTWATIITICQCTPSREWSNINNINCEWPGLGTVECTYLLSCFSSRSDSWSYAHTHTSNIAHSVYLWHYDNAKDISLCIWPNLVTSCWALGVTFFTDLHAHYSPV